MPYTACGAWPERGGCTLPAGHNQGMADVPAARRFPNSITFRLPVLDGEPLHVGDGQVEQRVCPVCERGIEYGDERLFSRFDVDDDREPADRVVVSAALGTVHATCYLARVTNASLADAWLIVAAEVAKRPSRHSAAEIRAALTALARLIKEK